MSGVNYISVASVIEQKSESLKYITIPFYQKGVPLSDGKFKKWGMTVFAAGSMRFRWNETNENRNEMLLKIARDNRIKDCPGNCAEPGRSCDCKAKPVSLELIHSKIVYSIKDGTETLQKQGDGMITDNPLLMPVVTVADCVPLFFYDPVKGVFGSVHSGWKGTGIIAEAIEKAVSEYGCLRENICVAVGPHIGSCCYFVDEERKEYFTKNFGSQCVSKALPEDIKKGHENLKYSLSLTEANLISIKKAGIPEENIVVATDCTCCRKFNSGREVFGSFRRQAAFLPAEMTTEERSKKMTVQAAFVI